MEYKPGEMLTKLYDAMELVPQLVSKREVWDSLIINRRKPYTYRVFTTLENGFRLCLHKFDPCDTHESFSHPHPWPGAFTVLSGSYQMSIGYSVNREEKPHLATSLELTRYSSYEIINPLTWHSVVPLETTYTVMVNASPWEPEVAHKDVKTTKGKDLEKMPEEDLLKHLADFKVYALEWLVEKAKNKNDREYDRRFNEQMDKLQSHNLEQLAIEKQRVQSASPYDCSVKRD